MADVTQITEEYTYYRIVSNIPCTAKGICKQIKIKNA